MRMSRVAKIVLWALVPAGIALWLLLFNKGGPLFRQKPRLSSVKLEPRPVASQPAEGGEMVSGPTRLGAALGEKDLPVAVDTDREFQDLVDEVREQVHTAAIRILPTHSRPLPQVLRFESKAFGPASDLVVQELLSKHIRDRSAVQILEYTGKCTWYDAMGRTGGSAQHRLTLDRATGSASCECSDGTFFIREGRMLYSDDWLDGWMDVYYMYNTAVFDPSEFRNAGKMAIELPAPDGSLEEEVQVHKLISDVVDLYFGHDDRLLRRIVLRQQEGLTDCVQIDLADYSQEYEGRMPLTTRVFLLDRTQFTDIQDSNVPACMELRLDPNTAR